MLIAKVPPKEIVPLVEMQHDLGVGGRKRRGKKRRKLSYLATLTTFAAAVTVLKKGRTVDAAIAEVATPNGISRKDIKNLRDRLNRGLVKDGFQGAYRMMVVTFKKLTRQILSVLSRMAERVCT